MFRHSRRARLRRSCTLTAFLFSAQCSRNYISRDEARLRCDRQFRMRGGASRSALRCLARARPGLPRLLLQQQHYARATHASPACSSLGVHVAAVPGSHSFATSAEGREAQCLCCRSQAHGAPAESRAPESWASDSCAGFHVTHTRAVAQKRSSQLEAGHVRPAMTAWCRWSAGVRALV